jgi:lysozyme family protein
MTSNFQRALDFVLQHECKFAAGHDGDLAYVVTENVPGDDGGLTKFGIDQADHPGTDIANLTLDQASAIYRMNEWSECACDQLADGFDIAIFDIAANMGCGTAAKLLQQACNETGDFNLMVDGFVGPRTIATAAAVGVSGLRRLLLDRLTRYYDIVTANPTQAKFIGGWQQRVRDLAALLQVNLNAIV